MMVGESSARGGTVRRCLFGRVDRSETDRQLNQLLEQQTAAASQKWGFNFSVGQPMSGVHDYVWEKIKNEEYVPPAYGECFQKSTTVACRDCSPKVTSASVEIPVAVTDKMDCMLKTNQAVLREDENFQLQTDGAEVVASTEVESSGC
jgi:hypothetical protein